MFFTASRAGWRSESFCNLFENVYIAYQMFPMLLTEYRLIYFGYWLADGTKCLFKYLRYGSMLLVNFMPMDDYIMRTVVAGICNTVW